MMLRQLRLPGRGQEMGQLQRAETLGCRRRAGQFVYPAWGQGPWTEHPACSNFVWMDPCVIGYHLLQSLQFSLLLWT